jgi:hypothetical protein
VQSEQIYSASVGENKKYFDNIKMHGTTIKKGRKKKKTSIPDTESRAAGQAVSL